MFLYSIQRIVNALVSDMLDINKEPLDPVMEDLCEKGAYYRSRMIYGGLVK